MYLFCFNSIKGALQPYTLPVQKHFLEKDNASLIQRIWLQIQSTSLANCYVDIDNYYLM